MSAGVRDVVGVTGITGYGKSTWLEKYLVKYPRRFIFDPFKAIPAKYVTADELFELHDSGFLKDPNNKYVIGMNTLPELAAIGGVAYLSGHCAFVIEECGFAFNVGERIPEWLQEAIFLGRHQFESLVFTAQRAISIPIALRSQFSRFISFRQTEPADVKWTHEKLGDLSFDLPTLPKYQCFDYDDDSVTRYGVTPVRK